MTIKNKTEHSGKAMRRMWGSEIFYVLFHQTIMICRAWRCGLLNNNPVALLTGMTSYCFDHRRDMYSASLSYELDAGTRTRIFFVNTVSLWRAATMLDLAQPGV
jgi:hypothetical protein